MNKQEKINKTFVDSVDPIVNELIKNGSIDKDTLNTFNKEFYPPYFSLLLNSLLVAYHPKFDEAFRNIRGAIALHKLVKYPHDNHKAVMLLENQIDIGSSLKFEDEIDNFFSTIGKNLQRNIWEESIKARIITGVLPVPPYLAPFELLNTPYSYKIGFPEDTKYERASMEEVVNLSKIGRQAKNLIVGYPAIVIRTKISSLNDLTDFIRSRFEEIRAATKNLPKPVIKRVDINITKLAIGLWIYKNDHKKAEEIEKLINERNEQDENYFGIYSDSLSSVDFPNFKSDALVLLDKLYPL
jgi:hypothetical protein